VALAVIVGVGDWVDVDAPVVVEVGESVVVIEAVAAAVIVANAVELSVGVRLAVAVMLGVAVLLGVPEEAHVAVGLTVVLPAHVGEPQRATLRSVLAAS
jgi:hypothetical protein